MTLIASWVSADNKPEGLVPSALYIGADSQYTWPDGRNYGFGQKTFCCINSPEIFGFCGDVLFPLNTINQLVALIDSSCFFKPDDPAEIKAGIVFDFIRDAFVNYPLKNIKFTIIYGTRSNGSFSIFRIYTDSSHNLTYEEMPIPSESNLVISDGSGSEDFKVRWSEMDDFRKDNYRTTRNVVYCLCNSIHNGNDKQTGGQPQIVGLYRGGNGKVFGYMNDGKRFLYGRETDFDNTLNLQMVEWRNNKFERINPEDMNLIHNASRHYFR